MTLTAPAQAACEPAVRRWRLTVCCDGRRHQGELLQFRLDRPAPLDLGALAPDERARAARFLQPLSGHRYATCRLHVRERLGSLLGESPAALRFATDTHGKPYLPDHPGLQFNVSHSGDRALLAWLPEQRLGVDIEIWRALRHRDALARRWFSPQEHAQYSAAMEPDRVFFDLWTHKEAVIKADGRGLRIPLRSFDVLLDAGHSRLARRPAGGADGPWALAAIPQSPGASAALAVQGSDSVHMQELAPGEQGSATPPGA